MIVTSDFTHTYLLAGSILNTKNVKFCMYIRLQKGEHNQKEPLNHGISESCIFSTNAATTLLTGHIRTIGRVTASFVDK